MSNGIKRNAVAIGMAAALSSGTASALSFDITYLDQTGSTGVGFDDAALGADRRATIMAVTDYLATVITDPGTIQLEVDVSETDGSGALAFAGPAFGIGANGFSNGRAFEAATTGVDPNGASNPEAFATFDFGYNYNSQTDAPTGTEFDLFSIALHEFSHALGFLAAIDVTGNSQLTNSNPGIFSVLESMLELGDGTDLFSAGGNYDGTVGDLTGDDIFFNGANAVAANGGNPVKFFAPNPFQPGSSIAHVDPSINSVLNPAIAAGDSKRTYGAIDLGILQDIGYTVNAGAAIPVPGALALMGAGMILLRRKQG